MTNFEKCRLTDAGISFLSKSGITIDFTRIETGCGQYSADEDISLMASLKDKVQDIKISNVYRESDSVVSIEFVITNKDLIAPYLFTEIGIYANDPEKGEVLYAVCFALPDDAEKIKEYNGIFVSTLRINLRVQVSPDSTVINYSGGEELVVIDNELSEKSRNPLANRRITEEFRKCARGPGLEFSVVDGILNVTYDDGR